MPDKIRIILDTNVVFSSIAKPGGSCARVIETILSNAEHFELLYTSAIEAEYRDVLYRPKLTTRVATSVIDLVLEALLEAGVQAISRPLDWLVFPDHKDKPFIEAAIYNNAVIVTGNIQDFDFVGLNALTPAEFLQYANNRLSIQPQM